VTEQLALPAVLPAMVQGEPVNEPVPPVAVKLTVPVGVVGVIMFVSVTVAEHVVDCPPTKVDGAHDTVVLVGSVANANAKRPSLPAWSLSPP